MEGDKDLSTIREIETPEVDENLNKDKVYESEPNNEMKQEEEQSIKTNCNFVNNFIDELSNANFDIMSETAKLKILEMKEKIEKWKVSQKELSKVEENPSVKTRRRTDDKFVEDADEKLPRKTKMTESTPIRVTSKKEVVTARDNLSLQECAKRLARLRKSDSSSDTSFGSDNEEACKKLIQNSDGKRFSNGSPQNTKAKRFTKRKSATNSNIVLETLLSKIDNRKTPVLANYDEKGSMSLRSYLETFENHCEDNLKGGKPNTDELESHLEGDTLKAFKAMKDVSDSYKIVKEKLLTWYDDTKELRKERYRLEFNDMKPKADESLFQYSTRMEKIFKLAYNKLNVQSSTTLKNKFVKTLLPKSARKSFTDLMFSASMTGTKVLWSQMQKCARLKDIELEKKRQETQVENNDDDPIEINIQHNNKKDTVHESKNYDNYSGESSRRRDGVFDNKNQRLYGMRPPPKFHYNRSQEDRNQGNMQQPNYKRQTEQNYTKSTNYQTNKFSSPPIANYRSCYKCGRMGHTSNVCRTNLGPCFNCGKMGHLQRDCYMNRRRSNSQPRQQNYRNYHRDRSYDPQQRQRRDQSNDRYNRYSGGKGKEEEGSHGKYISQGRDRYRTNFPGTGANYDNHNKEKTQEGNEGKRNFNGKTNNKEASNW